MNMVCMQRIVICFIIVTGFFGYVRGMDNLWNKTQDIMSYAASNIRADARSQISTVTQECTEKSVEMLDHVTFQAKKCQKIIQLLTFKRVVASAFFAGFCASILLYWYYTISWLSEAQKLVEQSQQDPNAMLYEIVILLQSWKEHPLVQAQIINYLASNIILTPELLAVFDQYHE